MEHVQTLAFPVAAVLIALAAAYAAWAVGKARTALAKKLGLDASLVNDQLINDAVLRAVMAAEEWAARRYKLDPSDIASGVEKAKWVQRQVASVFPNLLSTDINARIDFILAGLDGVGATGGAVGSGSPITAAGQLNE